MDPDQAMDWRFRPGEVRAVRGRAQLSQWVRRRALARLVDPEQFGYRVELSGNLANIDTELVEVAA